MTGAPIQTGEAAAATGREMHEFISRLYPICRSITGNGVRSTLEVIAGRIPLSVSEVPTGTAVFDWSVPLEWNIRDAYLNDPSGRRIVSFSDSNLHVLNYSAPVRRKVPLSELRPHIFTEPSRPDAIPYRTSYYQENWGFCMPHRQLQSLADGEYEAVIDSTLAPGSLTYGECFLPGETADEVLLSSHVCHPSLCNDNLSGIAVSTFVAAALRGRKTRLSYRFLFAPGTIGSISWLARNEERAGRIRHGLVLTCVGDRAELTYKRSRRGDTITDRAVLLAMRDSKRPVRVEPWSPYGYDERQFCSPGFDLAVGCLMRSIHGTFPEYHTSDDNLEFVDPEKLADSVGFVLSVIDIFEHNETWLNQSPKCEPQLGKRGLYRTTGAVGLGDENLAMLWMLSLSDGSHSTIDIAEQSGLPFALLHNAATALASAGLLKPVKSFAGLNT